MTFPKFAEGPDVLGLIAAGLSEGRVRYAYGDRNLTVQLVRDESIGQWLATVDQIPGAMAYGKSRDQAARTAVSIALHAMADACAEPEKLPGLFGSSSQLMSSVFRFVDG